MAKILILNGPNLNMLGIREKEIYGNNSYDDLVEMINTYASNKEIEVKVFQSNYEGALVDEIQKAYFEEYDGIVINPAAYTHTSIAILDAIKAVKLPCVEVHISDVSTREAFRQVSYIRSACIKTIMGKGFDGYLLAIDELLKYVNNK